MNSQTTSISNEKKTKILRNKFKSLFAQSLIDFNELNQLLTELFFDEPESEVQILIDLIKNELNCLDEKQRMLFCNECDRWIDVCFYPRSALIVVDMQNDFIIGSLPVCNPDTGRTALQVVPVVKQLVETIPFDLVAFTLDWHPPEHISFVDNVNLRQFDFKNSTSPKVFDKVTFHLSSNREIAQTLWPVHCVKNTWGSELHTDLQAIASKHERIYKGEDPEIDSYSAFFDNEHSKSTRLQRLLQAHQITDVYLTGLATEVCLAATAKDALELNYRTIIIEPASAGLDKINIEKELTNLYRKGAQQCLSLEQVERLISKDRRSIKLAKFDLLYRIQAFLPSKQ